MLVFCWSFARRYGPDPWSEGGGRLEAEEGCHEAYGRGGQAGSGEKRARALRVEHRGRFGSSAKDGKPLFSSRSPSDLSSLIDFSIVRAKRLSLHLCEVFCSGLLLGAMGTPKSPKSIVSYRFAYSAKSKTNLYSCRLSLHSCEGFC